MSHVGVWSNIWSGVCELYVCVLCVSAVGDHQEQCGFGFGVVSRRIVVFPHSGVTSLSCRSSLVWVFMDFGGALQWSGWCRCTVLGGIGWEFFVRVCRFVIYFGVWRSWAGLEPVVNQW